MRVPKVSIGIPVFNGENFLAEAIDSVLSQSFDDFEIVIADNASTDGTAEICRNFARSDDRIRYYRNPANLGAAPNYNRTFEESSGAYFKWLAHDDRIKPDYLTQAVAVLDQSPDVVLVNSVVDYIDGNGTRFAEYDSGLGSADTADPVDRFAAMILRSHSCVDFFGLARREAMVGSLLHGPFHGADRAYLAQMALRGRLRQIGDHLVEMREHDMRYTRVNQKLKDRLKWHDAKSANRTRLLPTLTLFNELLAMVKGEALTRNDRLRCYAVLCRWWFVNWNLVRAGVDLAGLALPQAVELAERMKVRLFGAAPGHFNN